MPTYSYRCARCATLFDELIMDEQETVHCPSCASPEVRRTVTAAACCTSGETLRAGSCACDAGRSANGCCGASGCSLE